MKTIALNIKQMKYLMSLGLDINNASMGWYGNDLTALSLEQYKQLYDEKEYGSYIPAYTLQDIFELLPNVITDTEYEGERCNLVKIFDNTLEYRNLRRNMPLIDTRGSDLLEAAYNMLIWCIDKNIIKIKKI